jgi:hypothetical protein
MSYRTKQSQVQAAAKAGISQRSARRIKKALFANYVAGQGRFNARVSH